MKRGLLGLLGALVVLLLIGFFFRTTIALRVMERVATRTLASDWVSELPDGLHVVLCGAGSPLFDAKRSGPCVAVIAGQQLFVVDAGAGASRRLTELRVPQGRIDAILLTHFHSDHIDGLGELMMQRWVNRGATDARAGPWPAGVEEVVGWCEQGLQPRPRLSGRSSRRGDRAAVGRRRGSAGLSPLPPRDRERS